MWIADVAALISRQTGMGWQRVADSASAVKAERMLHTGLRLASDLLRVQLPDKVQAAVQADARARGSRNNVASGCPLPVIQRRTFSSEPLFVCACAAVFFPRRLSVQTFFFTDGRRLERRSAGSHKGFLDAPRPFRLARKYDATARVILEVPSTLQINYSARTGFKKKPRVMSPSRAARCPDSSN